MSNWPPTEATVDDATANVVELLDWRRRIAELYSEIRRNPDPKAGWTIWQATRARLFQEHPQSPVPVTQRHGYSGPYYFPYASEWRVVATIEADSSPRHETMSSTGEPIGLRRWARAHFSQAGERLALEPTSDMTAIDSFSTSTSPTSPRVRTIPAGHAPLLRRSIDFRSPFARANERLRK